MQSSQDLFICLQTALDKIEMKKSTANAERSLTPCHMIFHMIRLTMEKLDKLSRIVWL